MKKVRKIMLIILLVIIVGVGLCAVCIGEEELRRIYYMDIVDMLMKVQNKSDYNYEISVYTNENILFNNGINERELIPQEKGYFYGYDNIVYSHNYGSGGNNFYFITMYEGNTIKVKNETGFDLVFKVNNTKGYLPFYDMHISLRNIKSVTWYMENDSILCTSEQNMGEDTTIILYGDTRENRQQICFINMFKNMGIDVYSFEIRKREDGTTMVFLDMDGDGIYEHDCSEYTYEYWQKSGLE